jgi:predicted amidohydrolase YtcJ
MRPLLLLFIVSAFLVVSCDTSNDQKHTVADTIYLNGKIYTANKDQPWAESVAIKSGRIIEVGSNSVVKTLSGDGTVEIDMDGKFMMPGIFDLHAHPFITPWYGSMNLSLINSGSAEEILSEVKAYAEANPEKQWIIGGQWLLGQFQLN